MPITRNEYQKFVEVLKEELLPAMGCTEPIAIAYVSAVARETLGEMPDRVLVEASGNIIKNVKSVFVPNTEQLRGIPASVAVGVVAGDASKKLEVISLVPKEKQQEIKDFLNNNEIQIEIASSPYVLDLAVSVYKGENYAKVRVVGNHTNIVLIEKNGEALSTKQLDTVESENLTDRSFITVEKIYEFANVVDISDVKELLDRQISYNMAISQEGLDGEYGANIGSVLLATRSNPEDSKETTAKLYARAMAAAGSDARMNGCELPVVINSGSGNQGITVSVPVITYGRHMGHSEEEIYRALVFSNLLSIHQKTPIGRLSAFCGAVSAGAAAGCAIAYLKGADLEVLSHALVNTLAIDSGVICDGAKASCAGKIAVAVDCGILGYEMYTQGQQFYGEDGIVKKGVENTIASVGRLASQGMKQTDKEILAIMLSSCV